MKSRRSIDSHLRHLCKQANALCDLGEMVSSDEFIVGVASALLTSGVTNGREKIGKKSLKKGYVDSRTKPRRKNDAHDGDGDGYGYGFPHDEVSNVHQSQNVNGRGANVNGRRANVDGFRIIEGEWKKVD